MWITKCTQGIELLATKSRIIYLFASLYYRLLVKRESMLAGIGKDDRVLCIGGGMCPYTAILLHQYTKARVTVIDNDSRCIEQSRCFLRHLGMEGVDVTFHDGAQVNCRGHTVIHIAMQISPKEAVLKQILKKAQDGARVLVRMPKNNLEGLYSNLSKEPSRFEKQVKHGRFCNVANTSVCVVRREPAAERPCPLAMAV